MNHDITYCLNWKCPFTDCERHGVNAPRDVPVSCAYLDWTCRRYIEYVLEEVQENRFKAARTKVNKNGRETIAQVSALCGISGSLICDLENPTKNREASYLSVAKLAQHYGVSTDWLCGLSDTPHKE